MEVLLDNVIPENNPRTFTTNASEHKDLIKIKQAIMALEGVESVEFTDVVFPKQFIVSVSEMIEVRFVEEAVNDLGFNALPKEFLSF
ncbi:heavy-metal-associated domain-containing protein [Formosa sediminum]|uniref:Heavy-metal-associated domain-containing protein n=1 Tax=Formosa sediminum TaxID=2594004 RepID=A0A516GRR2_9FLAO|nr:heavy-metal-associated domain-containing protein [Formosa sediminum]QDO94204.1 heavy-metal-associated domain-containing protein [Formosa sediminum]